MFAGSFQRRQITPTRCLLTAFFLLAPPLAAAEQPTFRKTFDVPRARLGTAGTNPYFSLAPGLRLTYRGDGRVMVRTVLAVTRNVGGVPTRVVEERELSNGRPVEITQDHYAIDWATGDVFYFGEKVDNYRDGKLVSREGTWLAGSDGATFGLAMPGQPRLGDRFYEELAPGKAMDRAEVVGIDDTVVTPAGTFEYCVHLRQSSALEHDESSEQWFAPGIGLVKDDEYLLVRIERPHR
jgi:hypothetical protein